MHFGRLLRVALLSLGLLYANEENKIGNCSSLVTIDEITLLKLWKAHGADNDAGVAVSRRTELY